MDEGAYPERLNATLDYDIFDAYLADRLEMGVRHANYFIAESEVAKILGTIVRKIPPRESGIQSFTELRDDNGDYGSRYLDGYLDPSVLPAPRASINNSVTRSNLHRCHLNETQRAMAAIKLRIRTAVLR